MHFSYKSFVSIRERGYFCKALSMKTILQRNQAMKTNIWLCAALFSGLLTGCMENDVYKGEEKKEKEYNAFDFSTVHQGITLQLAYQNMGVEAKVYFELYDQCPVEWTEYGYKKLEGVTPLFCGYTDTKGTFNHMLNLPAYLQKVWIYTPAFYAQKLIEAEVKNGVITATDDASAATRLVTETSTEHFSHMDENINVNSRANEYKSDGPWKIWLGTYDKKRGGEIQYRYTGTELSLTAEEAAEAYVSHTKVFDNNTKAVCPEQYRCYADIYVNQDAEVVVTYLGQWTCWNCSLGYYYYTDANKPTDLKNANVIMLFPNTQDGSWINSKNKSETGRSTAGIDPGTPAQLMYYPNIASDSREGATTVFPAGTRIGFVLATNAWNNRVFKGNKKYRASTSSDLSLQDNGSKYNAPRTAVYRSSGHLMISFEDYKDDNNFSDVIIAMKANPKMSIGLAGETPEVSEDFITASRELRGIYAFEDLWPNQGDYDLNDVVVRYDHEKLTNASGNLCGEAFVFKTFENIAANKNGLAFRLNPAATGKAEGFIRKQGSEDFEPASFTYEAGDQVYLLTDNVKTYMGAEYKLVLTYDNPTENTSLESTVQPFIYRDLDNGKRWEVHIAKEAPTSKMDFTYFRQGNDASVPEESIYYVRSGDYPFAFYLAGATETDISQLLDHANESKPIDQLFSGYAPWVNSHGTTAADWYK